ncbi:MAG: GTPase ObgE [Planctomycetota bacterium]|nr:MAG: GTPase ObgE [Planctomycetota bacterium]
MFLDRVTIQCEGGAGGNGCLSFRREAYVPRGGPDGGDGGRGGHVIVRASKDVSSLANVASRKHWRAERGRHGEGSNRHGRNGRDVEILVPPGTIVRDADRGFVLRDLQRDGEYVVVARGGRGGRGNAHFATATNRAPREFEYGEPGQARRITLELKLIADVGLIGKPNAGKSTLLSRMSRAAPAIAPYPFTTTYPNLGVVHVDRTRQFVMADIPGLIEGAHRGAGLGHEFLRHVERTRVLVHLVEPLPMDQSDPLENYRAVREELKRYDPTLVERPEIVAVTKADLPDAEPVAELLAETIGRDVWAISAVTGAGLDRLTRAILEELDRLQEPAAGARNDRTV